jgi:hypothetical protein
MNTEAVVYLARKLHWTRNEIGKLSPAQFNEILKELYYQESVDEWRKQHSVASIMAAIYNTIPRKRGSKASQAKDFLTNEMPTRNPKIDTVDTLAEKRGIKLPSKELKERG